MTITSTSRWLARLGLASALAATLAAPAAWGQAQRGALEVHVTDSADGSALPGVTVSVAASDTLSRREGASDADGVVRFTGLEPSTRYVVTAGLDGYGESMYEQVGVQAGQTRVVDVAMGAATAVTETLVVTAEAPIVDFKNATTGQDITLDFIQNVSGGRSYQAYLQVVPGVQYSVTGSDPASRSGLNYSDIRGENGRSTDNFYYFEGINVNDSATGRAVADINTEIIQEQSVLTGALPAEFIGATGLVTNVITKSGGNDFSGSVSYFSQNESLVADNENRPDADFDTTDAALTFGGPILRDKAWFFTSYRRQERDEDVIDPQGNFLRTVSSEEDQVFVKGTWAMSDSGLLSGLFTNDPFERDGSFNQQTSVQRDSTAELGGDRWALNYNHVFGSWVLDVAATDSESDQFAIPKDLSTRNDIAFRTGELPPDLNATQIGGSGTVFADIAGTETQRASLEWLGDSSWGSHTVKGGVELHENIDTQNFETQGDGAIYTSLDNIYLGQNVNAGEVGTIFTNIAFNSTTADDYTGLIEAIEAHPDRDRFFGLLDANNDGVISQTEVSENLVFNSTEGNPGGFVNYDRILMVQTGEQNFSSEATVFYLQDTWQHGRWSANVGVRAEEWEHFNSDQEHIFTFDTEIAPRLALIYDLKGDGRQRLSAYYGRYYDPVRTNMTDFAGQVSGPIRHEQVFVGGEWLTYRVRGGAANPDAFFAPATETPYTDEVQLGYKAQLGGTMSVEANLISRSTQDILEDYNLRLYAEPGAYGLPIDHPQSLFLGLDYFGYDDFPSITGVDGEIIEPNFIIATLAGGRRDWDGVELIFRRRLANSWRMQASYNYADAEGNTNSDSNADFQGDVLFLDPRAVNQLGRQPGSVEHLFKVSGSYHFDNGFTVGGVYRWNSGAVASRTFFAQQRNLPLLDVNDPDFDGPPIEFAGQTGGWLSPDAVGVLENPSFGILDARLSYNWAFTGDNNVTFYLDVFNVLDDQEITQMQDLVGGAAGILFGEGIEFVDPRRFFLGARLRF